MNFKYEVVSVQSLNLMKRPFSVIMILVISFFILTICASQYSKADPIEKTDKVVKKVLAEHKNPELTKIHMKFILLAEMQEDIINYILQSVEQTSGLHIDEFSDSDLQVLQFNVRDQKSILAEFRKIKLEVIQLLEKDESLELYRILLKIVKLESQTSFSDQIEHLKNGHYNRAIGHGKILQMEILKLAGEKEVK